MIAGTIKAIRIFANSDYDLSAFSSSKSRDRAIARLGQARLDASLPHGKSKGSKRLTCEWCSFLHATESRSEDSGSRAKRTYHQCDACNVHLYNEGHCSEGFHKPVAELVYESE